MTNENHQTHTSTDHKPIPFGSRLKSAREALGLERKDAADQLRLAEKVIIMMEKDRYPSDLPVTFIRGYLRSYGKLLRIPEHEIKKAIEPIKPKPINPDAPLSVATLKPVPVTSSNYFMQFFTYLIVITLLGLVGTWWYSHSPQSLPFVTEPQVDASKMQQTQESAPSPQKAVETTATTPNLPARPNTVIEPPIAKAPSSSASQASVNEEESSDEPNEEDINNNDINTE